MTRPLGSKNKPKEINSTSSTFANPPQQTSMTVTIPYEPEIEYDLCIGVRAHKTGRWKGMNLWELVTLNKGVRKVIIDATDRRSIINMVVKYIGKIVVAS